MKANAQSTAIAEEVVKLTGDEQLLRDIRELQKKGNIQLALHMADFVIKGSKDTAKRKEAFNLKAELLKAKAEAEPSYIARNIFRAGATLAKQEADKF